MSDRIRSIANCDLQKNWIAVDESGDLNVIAKDNRAMRFLKVFVGAIIRHDFYAHIRRGHVMRTTIQLASKEKNSLEVDGYIRIARLLGDRTDATTPILEAHPEMVAEYSPDHGCYTVAVESTVAKVCSNQALVDRYNEIVMRIFGNERGFDKNDARWLMVYAQFKNQNDYPRDQKERYWIECKATWLLKATVFKETLAPVQGSWWRLHIPKTAGEFPVEERVVFLRAPDLKSHQNFVGVIIENQRADVQADGTVTFPSARSFTLQSDHNLNIRFDFSINKTLLFTNEQACTTIRI